MFEKLRGRVGQLVQCDLPNADQAETCIGKPLLDRKNGRNLGRLRVSRRKVKSNDAGRLTVKAVEVVKFVD